jgi:hypothetical protein
MTIQTFELYVEPRYVSEILLVLSQIDGIEVKLPTQKLSEPDATKEHGVYSIAFAELAAIIVSISGTATALMSLATAVLQYKAATATRTELVEKSKSPKSIIKIKNTIVVIEDFSKPEILADYIQKAISKET